MTAEAEARKPPPRAGIYGGPLPPVPGPVAAYRELYRAERAPSWFMGWRHFAAIAALGVFATGLGLGMLRSPAWWEWAAVPFAFLFANFVEWIAHRHPMHHPMKPLAIMYEMHALRHHRVFTETSMEAETTDDFDMVLFSLPSLAFFMIGVAAPVAALFFVFVSRNAGWLYVTLALDYYVIYECFHLAYHLPEDSAVGRLPGMAALRRHHTYHHDQNLMADWNFNVTFPIFDRVFGTHWERRHETARPGVQ